MISLYRSTEIEIDKVPVQMKRDSYYASLNLTVQKGLYILCTECGVGVITINTQHTVYSIILLILILWPCGLYIHSICIFNTPYIQRLTMRSL